MYKSGEECSAIDFFLRVSIPQFTGNSPSEFWNRHVLQLAQQDVGTRHALVALAHLHRDFTDPQNKLQHNQPALYHYDAAIRSHISSLSGEMQDILKSSSAMSTAIVFMCIEIMQGHLASAVSLLQRSVAILPRSRNQYVPLYEEFISRLRIHAQRVSHLPATYISTVVLMRVIVSGQEYVRIEPFRSRFERSGHEIPNARGLACLM